MGEVALEEVEIGMAVGDRRRAPVGEPVAEAAGSQCFQPGEDRVGFGFQLARDPDDPGNGLADLESAGPGQDGGDGEASEAAPLRRLVGVAGLLRRLGLADMVSRAGRRPCDPPEPSRRPARRLNTANGAVTIQATWDPYLASKSFGARRISCSTPPSPWA